MPNYQFTEVSTISKTYRVWAESEDHIVKRSDQWQLIDEECTDSFIYICKEIKE